MAVQGTFGWELPDLSDIADGPDAFLQFADDIADTLSSTGHTVYTPSWTADGPIQPISPSGRSGAYQTFKGLTTFVLEFSFTTGTGGGSGPIRFGLPRAARGGISPQFVNCRLFAPGVGMIGGLAEIRSGESTLLPTFQLNGSTFVRGYFQNAGAGSSSVADAVPTMPDGGFPVRGGGYFSASGTYLS